MLLFAGCLTSQQHASVSQGRIYSDKCMCCHTEIEVADQTFQLTQSQYTDAGPTSPRTESTMPDSWQGSHWSANFQVTGMTRPWKNSVASGIRTRDHRSRGGRLTTRPTRHLEEEEEGAGGLRGEDGENWHTHVTTRRWVEQEEEAGGGRGEKKMKRKIKKEEEDGENWHYRVTTQLWVERTAQRAMEGEMLGLKLQDEIPCSKIRKRTKINDIIEYTLKQKWRWAGHNYT